MPTAVNDGEKRDPDRQQTLPQINIEEWLESYLQRDTGLSTMKRKSDEVSGDEIDDSPGSQSKKLKASIQDAIEKSFRENLFDPLLLSKYRNEYTRSDPYRHAVIQNLVDDSLLRNVRSEIRDNVHFTPKETDIYKIHQSGDLANLDGLDDAALFKLPSLLKLRNALYSETFRSYIAKITGSGPLSGRKTDMAINVYTPGCHLLCHDDVIGSRKVSYILYLTDPDMPWQAEWGGALRLYPTTTFDDERGKEIRRPLPDFSRTIPPAWNQLSFFAVQPGESFHDVEEVYHAASKEQEEKEGGRIRMAISGWYHIPQFGEEGYSEGEASMQTDKSSLIQLQGKVDRFDLPRELPVDVTIDIKARAEHELEPHQYEFLLRYISPTYLTPDTIMQIAEHFNNESSIMLDSLLSKKFALRLQDYIEKQEASQEATQMEKNFSQIESEGWKVARPPHKHRFLYLQNRAPKNDSSGQHLSNPIQELIEVFLPSPEFRWWLELATNLLIQNHVILARRFRRGEDYCLATSHKGPARLEICLGLTPTSGWGNSDNSDEEDEQDEVNHTSDRLPEARDHATTRNSKGKAKSTARPEAPNLPAEEKDDVGGLEIYMAGDEDGDSGDAAIYKASGDTEEDNILFVSPPAWNKLCIVLRDSGVLKFVKYLSKNAPGDRWDVIGRFDAELGDLEEEEEEVAPSAAKRRARANGDAEEDKEKTDTETMENGSSWNPSSITESGSNLETIVMSSPHQVVLLDSSEGETEWQGFQESGESDSD